MGVDANLLFFIFQFQPMITMIKEVSNDGNYYSVNLTERTVWDHTTELPMSEWEARERFDELQGCLECLDSVAEPRDPMDLVKEKMEGEL